MGAMLALHLLGLIVLLVVLSGWQQVSGIEGPVAFEMFPTKYLIPLAVLAAPLLEETVFRGWLSGRPRALWLLLCLIVAVAVPMLVVLSQVQTVILLVAALIAALTGWIVLRRRGPAAWFTGNFKAIFYASAVIFGLIHVFNYGTPTPAVLPMILPQVWAGLTLGYLRLRIGLPAAMLVHGTSNGLALLLAGLAG
jgi:membrane protease YdiL (CAAX protease family)